MESDLHVLVDFVAGEKWKENLPNKEKKLYFMLFKNVFRTFYRCETLKG